MTTLKTIQQNQIQKEVTINENFNAVAPSGLFAIKNSTTTGLTFGYFGGVYNSVTGTEVNIADGTITLTASSTNYIEYNISTNTVEKNTTSFTSGKVPIAQLTTNTTSIVANSYIDKRRFPILPLGTAPTLAGSSGGGLITNTVFNISAVSGLQVTVLGGRFSFRSSLSLNSGSIGTYSNTNITLPANSSGYIYITNNSITYVTSNVFALDCKPLYYFVTGASSITTLEDVRNSFVSFSFYPFFEVYKTGWAVGTEYSAGVPSFKDLTTSGNGPNLFLEPPMLRCTTTEFGYSVGDMVEPIANKPVIVIAQNLLKIVTNATTPQVLNRTAGSVGQPVTVTPGNWAIISRIKPAQ